MTPKGADLEATDLIEVSTIESGSYVTRSITGQELIDSIPPTTIEWGDIGGTLSNQTDLNTALNGKVPTTRTLTINGLAQDLSTDRSWTISTGLTVGTTPISSGTNGRFLFDDSGVLSETNGAFWDKVNGRFGIGTDIPLDRLHISTNGNNILRLSSNPINANIISFRDLDGTVQGGFLATGSTLSYGTYRSAQTNLTGGTGGIGLRTSNGANAHISFYCGNADADFSTERMRLVASTGNLLINTTTDAGFRLDVNGTARVQGNTTIVGTSLSSFSVSNGATAMIQTASSGIATSDFRFRLFNNGNTQTLDLYGSGDYDHQSRHAFRTNGTERMRIFSTGNVAINTTTDAGFRLDVNGTARVGDNLLLTNGIIATSSATTRLQGALNYFTHNRIASSGIHGFQISNYGSTASFWRYDQGTGDIEFGNSTAYGVTFFANNLARTKMWSSGQWTMGSATAYNASALVAMESTTTGFLPPRGSNAQMLAIASPAKGLIFFDNTNNKLNCYDGTTWQPCW